MDLQPIPPPLSGDQAHLTVGEMIIHYLKLEGVTHVFGIPGGGLINFLVNLKNNTHDINYVICRQETGAGYIADGYYRVTGNMGVVVVTTGPGSTNALTGVMNAQADGSAVLLITGEIDQKFDGLGYLQEGVDAVLDIKAIYNAAVSYSIAMNDGNSAQALMKQLLRNILALPRQAAHLSLPVNVTLEPLPSADLPESTTRYRTQIVGAPMEEVKKAMAAFLGCQRPLLFLGNGCRAALRAEGTHQNLLRFVETYGIPVITTADGKGIFPESHDLSLRVYGMADCMWPYYYLANQEPVYDGIMVIGSQLAELSTNKWSPILKPGGDNPIFIQVDINQKIIARAFEVTQGIVGEAGAFINDLACLLPEFPPEEPLVQERKAFIHKIKTQHSPFIDPEGYQSSATPIHPAAMMRVLQETMPKETKIFVDAGNCVGWSVHYLTFDLPGEIFTSLAMGPMGFAVGAVVGGKIGRPDATCIALTGDGAFMMQGGEISTAKQNKVGAIWIVFFDNNLSMVSQGMEHFKPDHDDPDIWHQLYELGNPDLVKYAEGLGADAYAVSNPIEMAKIMPIVYQRANEQGIPQVVVAHIDTKPIPPYYNPIYSKKPESDPND